CPLDFSILLNLVTSNSGRLPVDSSQPCLPIRRGLRLLHSDYLHRTGSFLLSPPPSLAGLTSSASLTNTSQTSTSDPPAASKPPGSHKAASTSPQLTTSDL
ncbi:hypothetical protein LINPERPRIM_LOCUS40783, partial [Linum perenne]